MIDRQGELMAVLCFNFMRRSMSRLEIIKARVVRMAERSKAPDSRDNLRCES